MMRAVRRICFFAPLAYPVLSGDPKLKVVGGAEVQQSTLAREFVRRGYEVSMVCLDHGQPQDQIIDGIRIIKSHRNGSGWPRLRTLRAFLGFWQAMSRADADLYYQRCSSALTGYVALFARTHRRLAIFSGAHDLDFVPGGPLLESSRDRAIYSWGLSHVDAIVTQTRRQAEMCLKDLGFASQVIRSCYGHSGKPADRSGVLLWAGRMTPSKFPERLVDIARQCPEYRFRVVGDGDPDYVKAIRQRASDLVNIEFAGFVPYTRVEPQFDGIAAFISTSDFEGFPNTFLQAWSRGVPTVSLFDPEARVDGRPVGVVVGSADAMAAAVRRLMTDREQWEQQSADSRTYFQREFALDRVADEYETLFGQLAARRPAR
jgi:glycosyltransferase involved in cell wall biosynthesis